MSILEKSKRKIFNLVGKVVNRLSQNEAHSISDLPKTVTEGMPELLRSAGAEGTVLLRNDGVLPLKNYEKIAVFGRGQLDYMYVGYGSGGDVIKPYTVSLVDGLKNANAKLDESILNMYTRWCEKNPPDHGFWAHWPYHYEEMPIDTALIEKSAGECDCAIVVIGRSAGEDRDNRLEKGSYYLTDDEESLIGRVSASFKKTVVILNIGSIMDMAWEMKLLKGRSAILLPYQGGMESGNSLADIIFGISEPSGRLTDTVADSYESYPGCDNFGGKISENYTEDIYVGYRYFETFAPEKVLYPFGFGLSYTAFSKKITGVTNENGEITVSFTVKNIGERKGKYVAQLYVNAPVGELGKPEKVLCGFKKSKLLAPNEEECLQITAKYYDFASFDDSGKSGNLNCYVLEKGDYNVYLGDNVRVCTNVLSFNLPQTIVLSRHEEISAPKESFSIIGKNSKTQNAVLSTSDLKGIIEKNLPADFGFTGDKHIKLEDVKEGTASIESFVAQLNETELEAISRGDYTMDSSLGNKGNAGAFGGVLPSLREKGIDPIITTDGPSGIRIRSCCSLLPVGTNLASMWNTDLAREIYEKISDEMVEKGSNVLLAPGMNIHRNPLCGRNFEYYSEDPYLTGKTAAAVVTGIQKNKTAACPKHFACNNQEAYRNKMSSNLTQRALREIYLKGFEICVKEAKPLTVMTSYNKVNGVYSHYNYELCNRILRGEWGFSGVVMTDWWMQPGTSPEFPELCDNAYRVRAGVDVLMPGGPRTGKRKPDGTLLKTYGEPDGITLGEMQAVAKHVCELAIKLK